MKFIKFIKGSIKSDFFLSLSISKMIALFKFLIPSKLCRAFSTDIIIYKSSSQALNIEGRDFSKLSPIRVLLFSHNLSWQGAQNSMFELAIGYKRSQILYPIILSPADGPLRSLYLSHDIPVVVGNFSSYNLSTLSKFNHAMNKLDKVINKFNVNVVHANTLLSFFVINSAYQHSIPCIWNIRESNNPDTYFDYLPPQLRRIAYDCFKYASKVIFVSNATLNVWKKFNTKNNFICIHNAIDEFRFLESTKGLQREKVRSALNIKPHENVIISVGTISERKCQADLLEAYKLLPDVLANNCRIFLIGAKKSVYCQNLIGQVSSLPEHVKKRITIIPETFGGNGIEDVAKYYKAADIFVLCSQNESYPRTILEAMYFGLPIVTTPIFGVVEQVIENKNALYYPTGDAKALSLQIEKLLTSEKMIKYFGEKSRKRFHEINRYENMIDSYKNILFDLYSNFS
jgi:glycosyltransferase involved in cell wall biosynthesis